MSDDEDLRHRPFHAVAEALLKRLRRARTVRPPPAPPKSPSPPPVLSEEDLLRREMAGVQPLEAKDYVSAPRPPAAGPVRNNEAEAMAELADLVAGRGVFDLTETDEYLEGIAHGLDKRLLKRLRQGQFAVQGHLDLHGKTRPEAHQEVEQFVLASRQRGWRCVLIVHGRGLNSEDQIPVLKQSLKVWLVRGRTAKSVLAFCTARPSDGGAGAVYVLLRR